MQISTHKWEAVDLQALAALAYAARQGEAQRRNLTLEDLERRLRNLLAEESYEIVLAHGDEALAGWLALCDVSPTTLEVNPGQVLGGHPVVSPDGDFKSIGAGLIAAALDRAKQGGFEIVTLTTTMTGADAADAAFDAWYEARGLAVQIQYVEMLCHLADQTPGPVTMPPDVVVRQVSTAREDDLYDCYHAAFSAGDARFFFDQSEQERRAYFDSLCDPEALNDPASLVLMKGQRVIGFSYVLPYGAVWNRHISCMCVHPEHMGTGLGKALLRLIMDRVADQGGETLTLGTEPTMRAFYLYRAHGFVVTAGNMTYVCRC